MVWNDFLEVEEVQVLNFHLKQTILQDVVSDGLTKQDVKLDVKYQNVTYYKNNRDGFVSALEFKTIDFLGACSEIKKIDWLFPKNHIGFSRKGDDSVLFKRKNETKWSAEIPVFDGEEWTGWSLFAHSDTNTILDMLRLFFEEVPWFDTLSWKMGRAKHD
jgi:hypothetical protein